jgi:regulator of protease activity HflC (stomatin/prohibitin superfamily)
MKHMFIFFIIVVILAILATGWWLLSKRNHRQSLVDHEKRLTEVRAVNQAHIENARSWATTTEPDAPSSTTRVVSFFVMIGLWVLALLLLCFNSFYTQDAGESVMQKDAWGNIVGSTTETGLHFKPLWVDTTTFNIRNQQVIFVKNSKDGDNQGGSPDGPEITTADADGVQVDIDVAIRYSIKPGSVVEVYKAFKSEDNFKKQYIYQAIRSAVRNAPNEYKTIQVLTQRQKVGQTIQDKLAEIFDHDNYGVQVDSVSLQQTKYATSVTNAYNQAQQAQIAVTKAQAEARRSQGQRAAGHRPGRCAGQGQRDTERQPHPADSPAAVPGHPEVHRRQGQPRSSSPRDQRPSSPQRSRRES